MAIAVLAAMMVFAAALAGWGSGVARWAALPRTSGALTIAVGLAAILFLGGVLNALHLAFAAALALIVIAGLGLLWFDLRHTRRADWVQFWQARTARDYAVAGLIAVVLIYTAATQLPPSAYSFMDDFGKYFFHPLAMLQNGTVLGSATSALGSEALGGKAFLDGFVVAAFPLTAINASDAVFGLALALALAAVAARNASAWAALLCVAAVIVVEPQYINISALYLGAALMLAAMLLASPPEKSSPLVLGLLYAGLISLKTTFALFVPLHLAAVTAAQIWETRRWGPALRQSGLTAAWLVLFVAPWLVVHAPHYWAGWSDPVPLAWAGYGKLGTLNFFATGTLAFGGTMLQNTLAVMAVAALAGLALLLRAPGAKLLAALAAACATGYGLMVAVFGPEMVGYGDGTRYYAPFLIAFVPLAMAGFANAAPRRIVAMAACAVPLVIFAPNFCDRLDEATADGFILGFRSDAEAPRYQAFNADVLDGSMRATVTGWQAMVPQGEPILAWINAPFYLDLTRNPVSVIDSAGLTTPWAKLPTSGYVIWEYGNLASPDIHNDMAKSPIAGRHERLIFAQTARTFHQFERLAARGTLLHNDGQRVAIFKLP